MVRILVDTNILLRVVNSQDPDNELVSDATLAFWRRGFRLLYTPQNMREFWNVATRPSKVNGLGFSTSQIVDAASTIERSFDLLSDNDDMHTVWRRLVLDHEVKGVQVHDARLAAAALVSDCRAILTLNEADFKRFGVNALHPKDVDSFIAAI